MKMMDLLYKARIELPSLLRTMASEWNRVHITYEHPHVRRLWRPYTEETRVYLHIIEKIQAVDAVTTRATPHKHVHPWPSAVMLLNGSYRMGISADGQPETDFILSEGSSYSMENYLEEHWVAPLGYEVMTLMVTGKPYGIPNAMKPWKKKPIPKQPPLGLEEANMMLEGFRSLLNIRPLVGI